MSSPETKLAAAVAEWLRAQRWEVYQEVEVARASGVAHLVGLRDGLTWVVEVKRGLTAAVAEQATRWLYLSNLVSVATEEVLSYRYVRGRAVIEEFLAWKGIGQIRVSRYESVDGSRSASERVAPRLFRLDRLRPTTHVLRDGLVEAQKSYAEAGNAEGKRWTPWQDTCAQLLRLVRESPGLTLKEAERRVRHHYASAASFRGSMRKWILAGEVPGVIAGTRGKSREWKLFLDEETAP